ncbi:hypothetical protein C8J27_102156 [Rhodobacter aestuarii]|uniref:Uncharacterized protein n=1 Tax=Rhodobacter aestuarii TaxID=453582 RepID=A0A1N7NBU7_9RHOB|nr:hypothetical protein [Rhodobacter aestuarii]PTV96362.1 hypothetical protein C8J27_102156 [Rhodobacter aestuarii]SIS95701.1 hypothetical protein SAMN05421580_107156 [Rhodobacter aestuarii]
MTALPQYERLEAPGLWRETPQAQRREVIVSFGDTSLVIADDRSATALTHWSLAALVRRNPGGRPAVFAPSDDPGEELEIGDDTMVEAIEKVQAALEARRPHPGRLRRIGWISVVSALAIGAVIWLPGALIDQAARVVPLAKRADIGRMMLADLEHTTGVACHSTEGDKALALLAERLDGVTEIAVLPRALTGARILAGGVVALGQDTLIGPDTPEVAAGAILAAQLAQSGETPAHALLQWAGAGAALSLLTTGDLPAKKIEGYGASLLARPISLPNTPAALDQLLSAFKAAGVASTPYAYAVDPSGETVLGLIEADPFRGAPAPQPVLDDAEWLALKDICS